MAEATVERASERFYCHECNREVSLNLPDFTCSQCQGEFIEQLSDSNGEEESTAEAERDPATHFAELVHRSLFGQLPAGNLDSLDEGRRRSRRPRTRISIRTNQRPGERGDAANATTAAAIDVILQNLFGGLASPGSNTSEDGAGTSGNMGFPFNLLRLHGNPADYAWGAEGLDSIITQLLNQMDGAGPPPADSKKIEDLQKVEVTEDSAESDKFCAVCKEQCSKDEDVRRLPCSHIFHFGCIKPWLKMHDSCPVCRLSLSNTQTRGSRDSDSSTPEQFHL
ncbi:hypothetical protein pdam_00000818 [Pocillopora damicornis]|uniref:RING-type E3 ubiquitin transferase n=1 Tax=Pocillopora damicornis TaxID=46731 RepID=A0A3M6TVQ2_POCDA|nr:hypothetical protein pdam_00000818 [Pocillopora damicornis]